MTASPLLTPQFASPPMNSMTQRHDKYHTSRQSAVWLALLMPVTVIILLYASRMFGSEILLTWTICILVLPLLRGACKRVVGKDCGTTREIVAVYLFLSCIGFLWAIENHINYGFTFSPRRDDILYFRAITDISHGESLHGATLYEILAGAFVAIVRLPWLRSAPLEHIDILPFNWLVGSFVVSISARLGSAKDGDTPPMTQALCFAYLLTQSIFIFNIVHLYRDVLMLLFSLFTVSFTLRNKTLAAAISTIPVFFIRGMNGMLLCLLVGLHAFIRKSLTLQNRNTLIIKIVLALAVGFIALRSLPSEGLRRISSPWASESQMDSKSLAEYVDSRKVDLGLGSYTDAASFTGRTRMVPLVGDIVTVVSYLFGQLSFNPGSIRQSQVLYVDDSEFGRKCHTDVYSPLIWHDALRILMFMVVFPWIIVGGKRLLLHGGSAEQAFVLFLITSALVLNAVSFQNRHSLFLVIMAPYLIKHQHESPYSIKEKQLFSLSRIGACVLVLIAFLK